MDKMHGLLILHKVWCFFLYAYGKFYIQLRARPLHIDANHIPTVCALHTSKPTPHSHRIVYLCAMLRFIFLIFCISSLFSCFKLRENQLVLPVKTEAKKQPKHVIFIIGDGFALSQASASVVWERNQSWLEKFEVVGFHKAYSTDDLITDSAAGATAFSTGKKTRNSYVGIDSAKQNLETIVEWAEKRGYATGMLVTSSVTHATPASFAAHVESRAFYEEIALSMLQVPMDCVIGGGAATYEKQQNGICVKDSLLARGYVVKSQFGNPKALPDTTKPFYLFTAENEPGTATSGRNYLPRLSPMVAHYLTKRSEKGSFLMIEASQIDWALHANDRNYLKDELHDFELMLESVLTYAAQEGNTLVVLTGDHECGGLSIGPQSKWGRVEPTWAARIHTGALVPVYAFGPQAELFNGVYENTEIYWKMREIMNYEL
jgi:alkaline phosphatase